MDQDRFDGLQVSEDTLFLWTEKVVEFLFEEEGKGCKECVRGGPSSCPTQPGPARVHIQTVEAGTEHGGIPGVEGGQEEPQGNPAALEGEGEKEEKPGPVGAGAVRTSGCQYRQYC